MENFRNTLYLFIDNYKFTFIVGKTLDHNEHKIIFELDILASGIKNNRIIDFEEALKLIKENLYLIEKKINFTFKEIVLILENFDFSYINITGYKKLNGSQIIRENITYILNSLKAYIDEMEPQKKVIHIFNSKFNLDNKKIENLPIGLFGDFYSHELSFVLINKNNYKNFKNIFEKCNLKIKKTLIKSFITGAYVSKKYKNVDTFFLIKINESNSNIFYFENNSLKFEQNFKFGNQIVLSDISKVTSLKINKIKNILSQNELKKDIKEDEIIERVFFDNNNYRKIKKKLIYDIAYARILEIAELIIFKNINFTFNTKISKTIFLDINDNANINGLKNIYETVFSKNNIIDIEFLSKLSSNDLIRTANTLVHFGWKKEAIPVAHKKKSLIAKFFEALFG